MQGVLLLVLMLITMTQASPAGVLIGSGGLGGAIVSINPGCTTGDCSDQWGPEHPNIWESMQCSEGEILLKQGTHNLAGCKTQCDNFSTCKGINYKPTVVTTSDCVLVLCDRNLPPPTGQELGYLGYQLLNRDPDEWETELPNHWESMQCGKGGVLHEIGKHTVAGCKTLCMNHSTCKGINYKSAVVTSSDCVLVICDGLLPKPTGQELGYVGYQLLTRDCPTGMESIGGCCYLFSTEEKNWQDARNDCQAKGREIGKTFDLVEVGTVPRCNSVELMVKVAQRVKRAWFGAHDLNKEGTFTWVHTNKIFSLDSDLWYPSEPNNEGDAGEDCVEARIYDTGHNNGTRAYFNDLACTTNRHYYVCQNFLVSD